MKFCALQAIKCYTQKHQTYILQDNLLDNNYPCFLTHFKRRSKKAYVLRPDVENIVMMSHFDDVILVMTATHLKY